MANQSELHTLLGDLIQTNSHLVRIAAQHTDSKESPAVWRTLGVLRGDRSLRIGELAKFSRVTQPTMTKLVAGLVERGWVTNLADKQDARATRIRATPAGIAALDAWRDEIATAIGPYFADLANTDAETLRRAIQILRDRLATIPAAGTTTTSAATTAAATTNPSTTAPQPKEMSH